MLKLRVENIDEAADIFVDNNINKLNRMLHKVLFPYIPCEVCNNTWDTVSPCAPCNAIAHSQCDQRL